jgi:hypothetical protein
MEWGVEIFGLPIQASTKTTLNFTDDHSVEITGEELAVLVYGFMLCVHHDNRRANTPRLTDKEEHGKAKKLWRRFTKGF